MALGVACQRNVSCGRGRGIKIVGVEGRKKAVKRTDSLQGNTRKSHATLNEFSRDRVSDSTANFDNLIRLHNGGKGKDYISKMMKERGIAQHGSMRSTRSTTTVSEG